MSIHSLASRQHMIVSASASPFTKTLAFIGLTVLVSMLAGQVLIVIGGWLFGAGEFAPLYGEGYEDEQVILSPESVAGLPPVVFAGEEVVTQATKCSREDNIGVTGTVFLRKLQPPPLPAPMSLFESSRVRDEGCSTDTYTTLIPVGTPPGAYEIVGTEVASKGARVQYITWHSQSFEVVADAR